MAPGQVLWDLELVPELLPLVDAVTIVLTDCLAAAFGRLSTRVARHFPLQAVWVIEVQGVPDRTPDRRAYLAGAAADAELAAAVVELVSHLVEFTLV